VALACFVGFAGLTAYKAWHGDASCGCFGRVSIAPQYTLVLDVAVVLALLAWRPRREAARSMWRRAAAVGASVLALGIPGGVAMATAHAAAVTDDGALLGRGRFVVLEPETWVGKRFPLLPHIDIGEQLSRGKWIVVLYSHDCSHCQEALPAYRQTAMSLAGRPDAPRVALIELPPYDDRPPPAGDGAPWRAGKLSASREWFAQTPVELALAEGEILFAAAPGDGLGWMGQDGKVLPNAAHGLLRLSSIVRHCMTEVRCRERPVRLGMLSHRRRAGD
jgi:hypothetical protein